MTVPAIRLVSKPVRIESLESSKDLQRYSKTRPLINNLSFSFRNNSSFFAFIFFLIFFICVIVFNSINFHYFIKFPFIIFTLIFRLFIYK
ncbi:unnamed protein product [Meloidogyne enterolobii]|uniref:Uncharacterized protein n=1 Tax=Meloidogyne enterolobii TaxID=390850 RepID=A0ACB1A0S2_MELEN